MKKLPPWGWALIAVGVGAAAWLYKKSKEAERLREEKEGGSEGQPVIAGVEPEEYPYSIAGLGGGGAGAGGAIGTAGESSQEFMEFERQSSTERREENKSVLEAIREANKAAMEQIQEFIHAGSAGGAPSTPTPGGVTVAPPPATAGPSCPHEYPLHNPANGAPSPHSCYRYSRDKCKSKTNPYNHAYQDGHHVCSPS